MATQQQINDIAGLYVAYFDRAPDPAGLQFWINQLDNGRDFTTISQDFAESSEAKEIYPFLNNPDQGASSPAALVTSVYANLFGRAPDQAGLDFWVNVLNSGDVLPGDMVEAIMMGARDAIVEGELIQDKTTVENKIECALEFTNAVSAIEDYVFDGDAYTASRQAVDGIDATQASVDAAKVFIQGYVGGFDPVSTFTLCDAEVVISEAQAGELVYNTVIYWGYNPHGHGETDVDNLDGNNPDGNDNNLTNEGPEDGGISAEAFFFGTNGNDSYLSTIIDNAEFSDLFGDGIDVDEDDFSTIDFGNLEDISVTAGDAGAGTITFQYSDGSADDIALGEAYFNFLSDLIFDEEGNSRFFEKQVAAQVPVYLKTDGTVTIDRTEAGVVDADGDAGNGLTAIGSVDAVLGASGAVTAVLPIVLTTNENNGSTKEIGFTSDENDLIQAGRLDMLHGAIIDGGGGFNTLEIDAKGHFAQPKSLINIQQISIENLPNIYTNDDGDNGSDYPDVIEDDAGAEDSIMDLSRATDLQNLTITEGTYDGVDGGLDADADLGELIVTGLRNDASLTLQGAFDEDVTVRTSEGNGGDGFTVILQNVNANGNLNIADNSTQLNIVSEGGGNELDSLISTVNQAVHDLIITGGAHLYIENDIGAAIFEDDSPATIDASGNSGGVDLNMSDVEQITFIGSSADDRFAVATADSGNTVQGGTPFNNDQSVTITNAAGDNYYDVGTYVLELTDGDGDINIEFAAAQATMTVGDGDNHIEGLGSEVAITAGDGDNKFDVRVVDAPENGLWANEDDFPAVLDLVTGGGDNIINVVAAPGDQNITPVEINVTAGDGDNLVQIPALPFAFNGVLSTVDVTTGSGEDSILVGGSDITIASGGGGDTITLLGIDNDYVTQVSSEVGDGFNYKGFIPSIFGATLDIDTGAGSATINLGAFDDDAFQISGALVAKEGSVITGSDITLFVNTDADLRAADLSGITSIVLDDDGRGYSGQAFTDGSADPSAAASLTLLDTQFAALGQDVFSTQGEFFGAQSVLTLVITSDTTLSDLIDFSTWNDSVKLCFVVDNDATLTLSAEELHKYVAPEGIAVDEENGYTDNQVIVTDAGPGFNAYEDQNGGTGGGTIAGDLNTQDDVTVLFSPNGYERPEQDPNAAIITWDSDNGDAVVDETVYSFASDLVILGQADMQVNGPVILGPNFTIDFSDFGGDFVDMTNGVPTLTVANMQNLTADDLDFNNWGQIDGNGTASDPVRIDFLLDINDPVVGDAAFGVLNGGLPSTGVQQYVLSGFHDDMAGGYAIQSQSVGFSATVVVCDSTEDLEVLGLQNNRNSDVTFEQVNFGTEILFEGDGYANSSDQPKNLGNPDLSQVGFITAEFFEAGANAVVRINNQGTELGLNEDAEDGFDPDGERELDVAGVTLINADRALIAVEDGDATLNALNGDDIERVIVTGPEDVKIVIEGVDGDDGTGLNVDNLVSIDASGVVGEFEICLTDNADLSGVDLVGLDVLTVDGAFTLTLTGDQVEALQGAIVAPDATLNVVEFSDQAVDFSAIDVDNVGDIEFSDVDGTIVVDPTTDFGDADSVEIVAEDSDTTVQMTFAQFETIDGGTVDIDEDNGNDATLALTDIPEDAEVDLVNIEAGADVCLIVEDFVPEAQPNGFELTPFDLTVEVTMKVSGTTDLSNVTLADLAALDAIIIEDGATLTLTADQLVALENEDVTLAGGTATLNIVDLDTQEIDLDELVADNPGLNIGTVSITDNNAAIIIDEDTTFGDADEIITPTADVNDPFDGLEDTSVTMTVEQFLSSGGVITGDGTVNLTGLANNNDSDGDFVLDEAVVDVSGITAPTGTITLLEVGPIALSNGETVTLAEVTDLSAFEIVLTDGQLIRFKTEEQADGATITEDVFFPLNPTGVAWLFTSVSGPIDTSNYSADLNTLFVDEALVNGVNEEDLWTFLAGSIVVQKFNDGAPNALVVVNRVNTFEAFGSALDGITFDDTGEFQTTGSLTLNLEGNVEIGDVTIADSNGEAAFQSLTITSTLDLENLPDSIDPGVDDPTGLLAEEQIQGYIIQPNKVGDIFLNAGVADGETVLITLDTSDQQDDVRYSNSTGPFGSGVDLDAGQALEIGTIFLGTPAAGENEADIDINGDNDVSIEGIDLSDPGLTQVNVLVDGLLDADGDPELEIAGVNMAELADEMSVTNFGIGDDTDLDQIVYLQDFTGDANTVFNADQETGNDEILLNVAGDNDIKDVPVGPTFQVDGVYASAPGTLNLTAAQIEAIGIRDAFGGADGTADNWVLGPGVNPGDVTINICELTSTTGPLDLDAIQAAGFNIGTITLVDDGGPTLIDLDNGTTLGGADQIVMELDFEDISLELTAEQFNSFSGVIVEDRSEDALTDDTIVGTVIIDDLSDIEDDTTGEVTIDVSNVETTGPNTFWIREAGDANPSDLEDNDTTFSAASVLDPTDPAFSSFSVTLADLNSDPTIADELAGQTIRFSTEVQADGRVVTVVGADDDTTPGSNDPDNIGIDESEKDEKDTNIVWLFDTVTGGLDARGYDGNVGRIWVSDELVDNEGGDVDGLFTIPDPENGGSPLFTLDADIIKRIETEDLDALLQLNVGINQRVEITSFTTIAGAEFEIDDPLVSIANLRIDMGGATDINDLVLDNILGPVDPGNPNFPGDDDFEELLINSLIANFDGHYLLPDAWTDAIPLPSDDLQILNQANTVGDISSGDDRGVLHTITINTYDADPTDTPAGGTDEGPADFLGALLGADEVEGADFVAETIYFSDDGDTSAVGGDTGTPTATLTLTGGNDVTVKSLDTSDVDITAMVVDTVAHTGTFTITGGSPAFDGDGTGTGQGDTTTSLTFTNGGATEGLIQFASTVTFDDPDGVPTPENEAMVEYNIGAGETVPYAGVSSGALEEINTVLHAGTISLGVVSQINGDVFDLNTGLGGQVFLQLGTGLDDGVEETPTLNLDGVWTFNGAAGGDLDFGGVNTVDIVISAIDVSAGGGEIQFNDVDVCIDGDVDLTGLETLTVTGGTTIKVAAGATLTLTVAQVDDLEDAAIILSGEGTVVVTEESDDSDAEIDTDFGILRTATVDLSAVTLAATDGNDAVDITVNGAKNPDGTPLTDENGDFVAQTIIGTANNDVATVLPGADDGDDEGIEVILRLGADSGSIGDPLNTLTDGSPEEDALEEVGDVIIKGSAVEVQVEVDAGFDQINQLDGTGAPTDIADVVQVAAGAEFYTGNVSTDYAADANTTNDGVAVIEDGAGSGITDVSAAGGANGIILIGADEVAGPFFETTLIGSAQDDTLIDGVPDTGNNNNEEDTFTGNGGADLFQFNVELSDVGDFADTETTVGEDIEEIEILAAMAPPAGGALQFNMRIGPFAPAQVLLVDGVDGADLSTANGIATALNAALNARSDVTSSITGDIVTASGVNGGRLDLINVVADPGGAPAVLTDGVEYNYDDLDDAGDYGNDPADAGDDDRAEITLELSGTIAVGETYTVEVTRSDGSQFSATVLATVADPQVVINDLADALETASGGDIGFVSLGGGTAPAAGDAPLINGVIPANTLVAFDNDADDGGFTISEASGTASISGASSSSLIVGGETTVDEVDPDVITDFLSGEDSITFGLGAGTNSNYDEGAEVADFATALADANAAMDGTVIYYLTSSAAAGEEGLLFFDANADGTADALVHMVGIDSTTFDEDDIV